MVDSDGVTRCKPAAGSVSVLPNGRIVYWNALEGTERIERSLITDYGSVALNDQSRLLNLVDQPAHVDGAVALRRRRQPGRLRQPALPRRQRRAQQRRRAVLLRPHLPAGRAGLATGGTAYYQDPEIADTGIGVVELEGLRATRIYDPATNRWSQTGSMNVGRWYPSLVSLGNGKEFVASGVEKLVKPVYPDHPEDSFTNVRKTETYDPGTRQVDRQRRGRRALAAAVRAPAPAAQRPRLLQRRGPVVQPARPVLRRGALERRRLLRPRDRGAGRTSASPASRAARSPTWPTSTSASRWPTWPSSASRAAARASPSRASAARRSR